MNVCEGCGKDFEPNKFTPYQRFCHASCRGRSKPQKKQQERVEFDGPPVTTRDKIEISVASSGTFHTITADPPWTYADGKHPYVGSVFQFKTMSLDEIRGMPVSDLAAKDAHLYLWVTAAFLPHGFGIVKAWGFRYITVLTWAKCTVSGKLAMGAGYYFRHCADYVLFGVRGRLPLKVRNQRNVFHGLRRRHSQKPEEFFDIVERCSPGPYLELFARSQRPGWTVWGDEI